ncbi:hypothetical protein KFL_001350165 [Klebsormidium nitens]|uniref:Uncharacterized protein n=1 Tax=Klebsormidium nitens TaxID=105231 RepID=A0A1Y1HZC7_KLENI|nr:hypothetical protein KFL_001350165 [Klebsormidium nitens]|eukprot:GAQ83092.1 hypothetical protein KFL_001350165 [Klebsormidium nitens]
MAATASFSREEKFCCGCGRTKKVAEFNRRREEALARCIQIVPRPRCVNMLAVTDIILALSRRGEFFFPPFLLQGFNTASRSVERLAPCTVIPRLLRAPVRERGRGSVRR